MIAAAPVIAAASVIAAAHVIACVMSKEGDAILWVWHGGEEEPSVRFDPPMGRVEATVVAFGDAAINQMLDDADKLAAPEELEQDADKSAREEADGLEDEALQLTQELADQAERQRRQRWERRQRVGRGQLVGRRGHGRGGWRWGRRNKRHRQRRREKGAEEAEEERGQRGARLP